MNNPATMEKMAQMRLWGIQRALRGVLEGGISDQVHRLMSSSVTWSMRSGTSGTTAGWHL